MRAQITAPHGFRAAPDGHTVIFFKAGEIVTGWSAEEAIIAGAARKIDEIAETLEYKAEPERRGRGRPRKVLE